MKLKTLLETLSIRTPWAARVENNLDLLHDSATYRIMRRLVNQHFGKMMPEIAATLSPADAL